MNLPNKITAARFFLSFIYFALLFMAERENRMAPGSSTSVLLIHIATGLFLIAAVTDVLDGYIARKYNSITHLGRIADPFVDKIIVCGSMVFFLGFDKLSDIYYSWMVVLILAREFFVHGLRVVAERQGIPFGATFWGKQKMFIQSVTVAGTLFYLSILSSTGWAKPLLQALVWLTVVSTVLSGIVYAVGTRALFQEKS